MSAATSPIRAARRDALRAKLQRGPIRLDAYRYRVLAYDGFSRTDVATAVDDLVTAGDATVTPECATLIVRLTGGSA